MLRKPKSKILGSIDFPGVTEDFTQTCHVSVCSIYTNVAAEMDGLWFIPPAKDDWDHLLFLNLMEWLPWLV